ncbi:MAG: glycosyltransferase family 2 protein [Patescibacteria group bacterium]
MNPKVSIIILHYKDYNDTKKCIESLLRISYKPSEIIVVDNSLDKSEVEKFKNNFGNEITLIENKKNLGYAEGNNIALKKTIKTSNYSLLLNNDTVVTQNFLEPLIDIMEKDKTVGAVQPKLLDMNKRDHFEYAGAAGGFMDVYGFPFTRGRIFNYIEKDIGQYNNQIDVVWCSGAAMLIRNQILNKTGFFDPIFFAYAEEADLCWRIHFCGYRMIFVPNSVVYHKGGLTGKVKFNKIYLTHRNGLYMLFKNYSWFEILRYLPTRICFDVAIFFYYLFSYPLKFICLAVPMGYLDFLLNFFKVLRKRKESQKLKKQCRKVYPLYKKSILIQYYFFKKRKYSDLNVSSL